MALHHFYNGLDGSPYQATGDPSGGLTSCRQQNGTGSARKLQEHRPERV